MSNGRRWLGLALSAVLVAACAGSAPTVAPAGTFGGPTASTATPTPTASAPPASVVPTATPPPPSPSPSPDSSVADWAAEICDINDAFLTGAQAITADFPDPPERTLAALKRLHRDRRPRIQALLSDALERTRALQRIPGGDPLQDAFEAEFENQQRTSDAFDQAAEAATSVEDIDNAIRDTGSANFPALLDSIRSVVIISLEAADAIAAIESGCRFFEFDARARLRGAVTAEFTETVIADDFEARGPWDVGAFDGGSVRIDGGQLDVRFTATSGFHTVTTKGRDRATFGDVRVESTFSIEPTTLSGLECRDDAGSRYAIQVNPLGLVLIYRWAPDQQILGRRGLPEGALDPDRVELAIECVGGADGEPVVIAAYHDGERIAEVIDAEPLAAEGLVGMFAQAVGPSSRTTYDDFAVRVPSD